MQYAYNVRALLFDMTLEKYICPLELKKRCELKFISELRFFAVLRSGCLPIASALFCKKEEPRKICMYSHDMNIFQKQPHNPGASPTL